MAKKMSKEHREALAKGRRQARAVREYLRALERGSSTGRRLSREELEEKVNEYHRRAEAEQDPAKRVELVQRRLDFEERLAETDASPDGDQLKEEFVEAVADYSERKGISYTAWREVGVPAGVLRDAGIPRTRRPT